jgi:hypothetical protein
MKAQKKIKTERFKGETGQGSQWAFSKPPVKEAVKIKRQAEAMRSGKLKSIPLSDIIQKLEKMP